MKVYIQFLGELRYRAVRDNGEGKYLGTTIHLDTGTEYSEEDARLVGEALYWSAKIYPESKRPAIWWE